MRGTGRPADAGLRSGETRARADNIRRTFSRTRQRVFFPFAEGGQERGRTGELLVTSMDRDGTKSGYDIGLTRSIADQVRVPVIASGGVGTLDDLVAGVRDGHATAVLAASIFHFGTYSIGQAKTYMAEHGIPMRLD